MKTLARSSVMIAALLFAPPAAHADAVLDWNAIMLTTVAGQNPFAQARTAAITQLAVFEAVNACTGHYNPYLGEVTAPRHASADAAAVSAAHAVLKHYVPGAAAALDAARAASLSAIPGGAGKAQGIAVGDAAAAAMIAARANDGAAPAQTFVPESSDPGIWQPTPPAFGPGVLLHWRNLTPFALKEPDKFRSDPPPPLGSRRYARDFAEVLAVGSALSTDRPQDRTDVARYFAVASAVHAWNSAVGQVSAARGRTLAQNARALALLNMAISDALVASMNTKYHYTTWRPVTAIHAADRDGNPRTTADPGWLPLIDTPSFPGYPSAHASASYAARWIAERLFGERRISFVLTHPAVPGIVLDYEAFSDLTDDIDDARVYGGIHFRFDQQAGAWQGRQVGEYVATRYLGARRKHDQK
jgi:membrane-associated phospholipid phosphatase